MLDVETKMPAILCEGKHVDAKTLNFTISDLKCVTGPLLLVTSTSRMGVALNQAFSLVHLASIWVLHTEETRIERNTCTPMFIAALFLDRKSVV